MLANFSPDGVQLHLDRHEYGFLYLTLSYVLHGIWLPDHDFRNVLGMSRDEAESLFEQIRATEETARRSGEPWHADG